MKHMILAPLLLVPFLTFAMPLSEMVQQSVKTHPQVLIAQEDLNIEEQGLVSARSDWLPTLDASYKVGPESTKTPANAGERADLTRQEAAITLTQNIFAGFNTKYGMQQQRSLIISADKSVEETANNIAIEAVGAYLEVMRMHDLLMIAQENVAVHEKYLKQIKRKVDAGVQRNSDYVQTLSRLENAKGIAILSEQNYDNAVYSFQRILPSDVSGTDLMKPDMNVLPAQDIDALVQMAMQNNPTINVSKADVKAAQSGLSRSNSNYYPTADIVAEAHWNDEVNGVGFKNNLISPLSESKGMSALLVLNYNIFNGMSDAANKQTNKHLLLKQQSTLVDAERFVMASTKIAWKTYMMTDKQLEHLTSNVKASKLTLNDYQKENDLGRRSIIDLLNIELEYNSARNRQTTAEYDQLLSYYQILSNTGTLLGEMDIVVK